MNRGFSLIEVLISLGLFSLLFFLFAQLSRDVTSQATMSSARQVESVVLSDIAGLFSSDMRSALTCSSNGPSQLSCRKILLTTPRGLSPGLPEPLPASWSPYRTVEKIDWRVESGKLIRHSNESEKATLLDDVVSANFSVDIGKATLRLELPDVRGAKTYHLRGEFRCRR